MKRTFEYDSERTQDASLDDDDVSETGGPITMMMNHSPKRPKRFSATEFRRLIQTDERSIELERFLNLLKSREECDDVICEYFQYGGNCLELMQIWEVDTTCSVTTILEIVQRLIVAVVARHPKMHLATLEACRYLLNTHLTLVNKMLQLASTQWERWVTLKLLATMVSFSPKLVKDILLNVKFQVNLLTKHMSDLRQSVRLEFINFLVAFFVDGHYPTMLQLVGRKYMFGSIMPGLKYDPYETVVLVLKTLKTHIVDNESVPKPTRIQLFTNTVVKGMVHLYDWCGPHCMEERRQRSTEGDVNADHRATIAELVHELLLVLCTSFKRGVIFRDESYGTGTQHRNPLMFNIIEMSFCDAQYSPLQQELIIKMAAECPDLVKTVWAKLMPSLEPRATVKWLRAVGFLRQLVAAIKPHGSVHFAKQLRPLQFAQMIQFLVTPSLVLEQLLPSASGFTFETDVVKQEVALAIHAILKAVQGFMLKTKDVLPENYCRTLRRLIEDHLQRHMPSADLLLRDWMSIPVYNFQANGRMPAYERLTYMTEVVQILRLYHQLCPERLSNLRLSNFEELLTLNFNEIAENGVAKVHHFKVSLIQLMIQIDPAHFHVARETLPIAIEILSRSLRLQNGYLRLSDADIANARQCIGSILKLTGFFTDCDYEVEIWTEVLKYRHFPEFFCPILTMPQADVEALYEQFRESSPSPGGTESDILNALRTESHSTNVSVKQMKPVKFSCVIATALQQPIIKKLKKFLGTVTLQIFHIQTDYRCFQQLVRTHPANVPDFVTEYIKDWPQSPSEPPMQPEIKFPHLKQIVETSTVIFKLFNMEHTSAAFSALVEDIKQYAVSMLDMIYRHPKMFAHFRPANMNKSSSAAHCVKFLTEITEHIQSTAEDLDIAGYLKPYQMRFFTSDIKTVMQSNKAYSKSTIDKFTRVIRVFGLSFEQCTSILDELATQRVLHFLDADRKPNIVYFILAEVLNTFSKCCEEEGIDDESEEAENREMHESVKSLLRILTELNRTNTDTWELAAAMRRYLTLFTTKLNGDNMRAYFISAVQREEYCKENAQLAIMIFQACQENQRATQLGESLHAVFVENLEAICHKKGLILPLLEIVDLDSDVGARTFGLLAHMLQKTLQKPSKAGQHFERHYSGFCYLLQAHVPFNVVQAYLDKTHKADTTEVFLPAIWKAMFTKYFADCTNNNNCEKQVNNAILTFVHYIVNMLKVVTLRSDDNGNASVSNEDKLQKVEEVTCLFVGVLSVLPGDVSTASASSNETFKLLCRICLKYGIGPTRIYLVNLLAAMMQNITFSLDDTLELLDLLFSHSGFMDLALSEPSDEKLAVFELVHVMCRSQPGMMERKHVPLLLSAYTATMHPSDRRLLTLLTMYERAGAQTLFYDFKPFLWGLSAGSFYTVRQEARRGLWRQPRTGDVLDILQVQMVESTILSFPVNTPLGEGVLHCGLAGELASKVYDVGFLISVFSQLLEPECTLVTHKFTRSGALSVVVVALASVNQDVRTAACHLLARFFYHLESTGKGRDHLLWLRFVEVVSKAAGAVETLKLNGFSALFMARAALILTNPTDPMYEAISNFICVTNAPNLTRIPELYTFLNSSALDHQEQRRFILQILYDGMRTDEDGLVANGAMAFKLMMDLYTCTFCDVSAKLLILDVFERAAVLPNTARILCRVHGLSAWLYNVLSRFSDPQVLARVIKIHRKVIEHEGLETSMVRIGVETTRLQSIFGSRLSIED